MDAPSSAAGPSSDDEPSSDNGPSSVDGLSSDNGPSSVHNPSPLQYYFHKVLVGVKQLPDDSMQLYMYINGVVHTC